MNISKEYCNWLLSSRILSRSHWYHQQPDHSRCGLILGPSAWIDALPLSHNPSPRTFTSHCWYSCLYSDTHVSVCLLFVCLWDPTLPQWAQGGHNTINTVSWMKLWFCIMFELSRRQGCQFLTLHCSCPYNISFICQCYPKVTFSMSGKGPLKGFCLTGTPKGEQL